MTPNSILIPISGSDPNPVVMETGVRAAKAAHTHAVALFVDDTQRPSRQMPVPGYSVSMLQTQGVEQLPDPGNDDASRLEQELHERFQALCAEHGVVFGSGEEAVANGPTAAWRAERGEVTAVLDGQASDFDLVVAGGNSVSRTEREIAEHVLLRCERPVLLSSTRPDRILGGKVAIAWWPSDQCWHAVLAAMPLLKHAKSVAVISVSDGKNHDEVRGSQEDIVGHLAKNGLKATARVTDRNVRKVPDAIMNEATELGAGLLVMGAYSHSPLYEMIFGGVTRTFLARAAATPVLMAH